MHRIMDNAWAQHGSVASREQVQVEISFPHHMQWLDLFLGWWEYGRQQARSILFRTRERFVKQRTEAVNALRSHLYEFGFIAPEEIG